MNPHQRKMCKGLTRFMADLFADPDEERKFKEWLAQREKRRDPATNDSRATPLQAASV